MYKKQQKVNIAKTKVKNDRQILHATSPRQSMEVPRLDIP